MAGPINLGQFEQVVLTAVLALRDDAYGVTIHGKVASLSGSRRVTLGAVYATLDRLEDKGLVTSCLSDPTPQRGGRSKRYYRLAQEGRRALADSAAAARRMCDVIEDLWGDEIWHGAAKARVGHRR